MVPSFLLYPDFCMHNFNFLHSSIMCLCVLRVFRYWVPCCEIRYHFRIKRCSVRLYLQLLVGWPMSYLRYLCLFAHSSIQHIMCCVFIIFCLSLVYPMLPVSLDCPYCIAPLVFSDVYLVALRFLIGLHLLHLGQTLPLTSTCTSSKLCHSYPSSYQTL